MGEGASVLLIDDELAILRALRTGLRARGYDVASAQSGEDGLRQAQLHLPDVIVLDLGLPDVDGVEVCRRLRAWTTTPIIVLSADGSERRKVEALDEGADDYVTKPFGMAELQARLRVALRHRPAPDGDGDGDARMQVGGLIIDPAGRQAECDGTVLDLTAREFDFLAHLARHPGKVLTHRSILEAVWGPEYRTETHYLRVYVSRLRRKLGTGAELLHTSPGVGYRLVAPE